MSAPPPSPTRRACTPRRWPRTRAFYEHIDPALVGNAATSLVSDQAGRANLMFRFAEMGLDVDPDPEQTAELLALIKDARGRGLGL